MEYIHETGYQLLSIKYLFELQEKEGQAADFIQYIPKCNIFNKDGYFREVNEYLVIHNNEYIKRLLETHLQHTERIIDIWNKVLSIIPENKTFETIWDNRYDIYCSFRQNLDFPFQELYLVRNRLPEVYFGNTAISEHRYWNLGNQTTLSNFNLNNITVYRIEQIIEEVNKIHTHLSYMLYGNNKAANDKINKLLFDFGIVSKVHKACNNKQFEDISEEKLYNFLNYPSQFKGTLQVKPNEKTRMYYLIGKLSESIKNDEWTRELCDTLDFSFETYQKKKTYIEEDKFDERNPNTRFLKEIESIF
ncbi:MAG: hypothetical protein LBQ60_05845 [Bacteroidales bacterium]|nr:hypothetical protein [Bacteroidales bacterium]